MNTSTYMTTMLPIILASANNSHGSCGCNETASIFGKIFVTIVCFGLMFIVSYFAWDMRDDIFNVFIALFFDLVIFMVWLGMFFLL